MKYPICLCILCSLIYTNTIHAKNNKKPKIPKEQIINNFHSIAQKNEKKSKKNTNALLSFRSSDFEGQYYVGGNAQIFFEKIAQNMLNKLDEEYQGLVSNDLKQNFGLYVIHSQSFNAHSTRNNNILLTTQWIIDSGTEAEVATVIAHELAHLILKHPDTSADRQLQASALKKYTNIASAATFLAGLRFNTVNEKLNVQSTKSSNKEVSNALLIGKLMVTAKKELINPKISRKNEDQADFFAMDLINLVGYPLEPIDDMFKLLIKSEEKNKKIVELSDTYITKIQPVFEKWVSQEIAKSGQQDFVKKILFTFIMQKSTEAALKVSKWFNDKKRKHLRPELRQIKVDAYKDEFYTEQFPSTGTNTVFEAIQKEIIKIDDIFEKVAESNILINEGKYREAGKNLSYIKSNTNKNHPVRQMFWMVLAKLRIAQGRYADAIENICKFSWGVDVKNCYQADFDTLTSSNDSFFHLDEFTFLSEAYIHNNEFEKANLMIEKGSAYYSDDTPFQIHEIIMGCEENDYSKFKQGLEKCKNNDVIEIGKHCQTIEKHLELLLITEKNRQKKLQEEKTQTISGLFSTIKQEELAWQTTCKLIKDNKPFSSITKNSEAINKKVLGMLDKYKSN